MRGGGLKRVRDTEKGAEKESEWDRKKSNRWVNRRCGEEGEEMKRWRGYGEETIERRIDLFSSLHGRTVT